MVGVSIGERVDRNRFAAVLFDMDGVVTDTASAHAKAWKRVFDSYLESHAMRSQTKVRDFDLNSDYREYVDGKSRYDGVSSFLESREIHLPLGDASDDPAQETICGIGNRKNVEFNAWLRENKVRIFPGTVEFAERLRACGVPIAIFSASQNMDTVLASAGLDTLFDARVDGLVASRLNLRGKPDPAMLETAAAELDLSLDQCIVVEDAIAGAEAGRRGSAEFVIGIDREDYGESLRQHGADLVVNDLSECRVDSEGSIELKRRATLPSFWDCRSGLKTRFEQRQLVVLLDYDGTLTPIVADYRKAVLHESMRRTLERLADHCIVGVISGRDLPDVRRLVGLESLYYSGSHGFELAGPSDWHHIYADAADYVPDLDSAEAALTAALAEIPGHAIERKQFAIAVHYRQVDPALVGQVEQEIDEILARNPRLHRSAGKKVFEIKPALQWDKGRAVELLLENLDVEVENRLVIYVGDDITDESAFHVVRTPNVSIVVGRDDPVTAADYSLNGCDDVLRLLQFLSRLKGTLTA